MRHKIDGQTVFAYARKRLRPLLDRLHNRGGFLPPEKTLCADFGISRNALKSAIDSFVAEGVLEVRPRKGNYVRKVHQIDFRIGVMTGVGEMPFLGLEQERALAGAMETMAVSFLACSHLLRPSNPEDVLELARQYALDGVLWIEPAPDCRFAFEELLDSEIPAMAVVSSFDRPVIASNYVWYDYAGSGRLRAAHLLARGCRRIAYVGKDWGGLSAFKAELASAGVEMDERMSICDVASLEGRLRDLLNAGHIDGIASDGGNDRLEALTKTLLAHSGVMPELMVDYLPQQRRLLKRLPMDKLTLNVMPAKELGSEAVRLLLGAKGKNAWRAPQVLVESKVVPAQELFHGDSVKGGMI